MAFKHFDIFLPKPDFDSELLTAIFELTHLRRRHLRGTTHPQMFFQIKAIFHLLESVGSARIEGNNTTISEYVEQKIIKEDSRSESFLEIENVEKAMSHIEESIDEGTKIDHDFFKKLHEITVMGLQKEGDKTPGDYRTWPVDIQNSEHTPALSIKVTDYMDELIEFINNDDTKRYDLIKIAIAHHRFAWIHPFGNGNGRVVRLLTYALLIKYGFRVRRGQIINPTAVFCNDREKYYSMLALADKGTHESMLTWCDYVLTGICQEITKIDKLLDYDYLKDRILIPSINLAHERKTITKLERDLLTKSMNTQTFKAELIKETEPNLSKRQRAHVIQKMKKEKLIMPIKEGSRTYIISFQNNYLMRYLVQTLEKENFIPPINE